MIRRAVLRRPLEWASNIDSSGGRADDDTLVWDDTAKVWKPGARINPLDVSTPWKDKFTVASSPATTYTLTYLPLAHSMNLSLNGVELVEGTDYTVDNANGIVTVSATLKGTPTPADVLTADYWTTARLIASPPAASANTEWSISSDTAVNVSSVDAVAFINSGAAFSDISGDLTVGSGDCCLVFASCPPLTATDDGSFLFLRGNPSQGGIWRFSRVSGVDSDTQLYAISDCDSSGSFSVSASGSTLTVVKNSVTVATVALGTSDAALLSQTYVGLRGQHGVGSVVDNFSAQGGAVTDAFNRPDSVTLGTADTGQTWLGNR